jgi:low affinity Fe/Cu permease
MARKRLDAPVAPRRIIIRDIGRSVSLLQNISLSFGGWELLPITRIAIAIQRRWEVKLDEIIRSINGAHNGLLDLEEHELDRIRVNYSILAKKPGRNSTRY